MPNVPIPKRESQQYPLTAEGLTSALDGRWNGRSGLARCPNPNHPDRHPSFSIAGKGDRIVFICRAGCDQHDVVAALTERGLWSRSARPHNAPRTRAPVISWEDRQPKPPPPPCCLQGPETGAPRCEHWRRFDADMTLAHLRKNLLEASDEISNLYKTAGYELDAATFRNELNLAVECAGSAIVPWHLDPLILQRAIDLMVGEVVG